MQTLAGEMAKFADGADDFDDGLVQALANKKLLKHRESDVKCAAAPAPLL